MPDKQLSDIEKLAIQLVRDEKTAWEDIVHFVTDRVAFNIRPLIKQLRKHYWGIFDVPVDPTTGRKKIWVPFTESLVETVVKTIDLDTKDVNFRARKAESQGLTTVVRAIVKYILDCIRFGEKLDLEQRDKAIDGTAVWKILPKKDSTGKLIPNILKVDLLNCYIDPSAPSIQEAYRFTERALMFPDEIAQMDWMNNKGIEGTVNKSPNDSNFNMGSGGTTKQVDVWESWGKFPKYLLTGKKADKNIDADIRIVVSGLESPGKERVHVIEGYDGLKPYEEDWYSRVSGRWHGRGIAEKVMMVQLWLNTIVNIRINRSYVSQLGLFKVRKGSGVTPQMLARLPQNGAVVLNDINDLEQMVLSEAGATSYKDEESAVNWGRQVTAAFEIITGESLPGSTSATSAALQSQSAQSQFSMVREGTGMFIERVIQNHMMPMMFKYFSRGEIIRIVGDDPELIGSIDEQVVYQHIYNQLEQIRNAGLTFDPLQVQGEIQKGLMSLQKAGKERYVTLLHDLNPGEYDVKVYVTNEEFDKGVMLQNLNQMLATLPALGFGPDTATSILKQTLDVMGLDSTLIKPPQPMQPVMNQNNIQQSVNPQTRPGGNPPNLAGVPPQGLNEVVAASNTLEPNG